MKTKAEILKSQLLHDNIPFSNKTFEKDWGYVLDAMEEHTSQILINNCYPEKFVNWLCYHSQQDIDLISYWDGQIQDYKKVFCKKGSRSVIHDAMTLAEIFKYWDKKR